MKGRRFGGPFLLCRSEFAERPPEVVGQRLQDVLQCSPLADVEHDIDGQAWTKLALAEHALNLRELLGRNLDFRLEERPPGLLIIEAVGGDRAGRDPAWPEADLRRLHGL